VPSRSRRRTVAAAALACGLAVLSAPAAAAPSSGAPSSGAPASPPARANPPKSTPGSPAPPRHYVQTTKCVQGSNIPRTVKNGVSWAQTQLNYTALWSLGGRGAGQRIAVIDTGVNPEPSAFGSRLRAGADLVQSGGDGLSDCDGHGTVVAGIIAAAPDSSTGFAGVAPSASLISIRQSSLDFGIRNAKQSAGQNVAGTTASLAGAIMFAARSGADVINISEASCRPGNAAADAGVRAVQRAVDYAINVKDAVVVAAAGNVDSSSDCKTQNVPGAGPQTIPVPASVPGVLAVGAVDKTGAPAAFSLAGTWVGVAAPGVDIVATNPLPDSTGQINKFITSSGVAPVQGTSFATPYVAGLVALVRNRYPDLDAAQVVRRIERTAVHPAANGARNDFVGYGMIDPEAALTAVLPGETPPQPSQRRGPQTLPAAQVHPDPERHARLVALLGTLGLLVAVLVGVIATITRRRRADHLMITRSPRTPGSAGRPRAGSVRSRR
jgi:membrane-anchored mycosin MYCP